MLLYPFGLLFAAKRFQQFPDCKAKMGGILNSPICERLNVQNAVLLSLPCTTGITRSDYPIRLFENQPTE
jgi:hypothetical protein